MYFSYFSLQFCQCLFHLFLVAVVSVCVCLPVSFSGWMALFLIIITYPLSLQTAFVLKSILTDISIAFPNILKGKYLHIFPLLRYFLSLSASSSQWHPQPWLHVFEPRVHQPAPISVVPLSLWCQHLKSNLHLSSNSCPISWALVALPFPVFLQF